MSNETDDGGWVNSHDDQVDEVDAARLVQRLGVEIRRYIAGHVAEAEPKRRERYASAMCVPIANGKREDRLDYSQKTVRLEDESPVDELVLLRVARGTQQHVRFRFLEGNR